MTRQSMRFSPYYLLFGGDPRGKTLNKILLYLDKSTDLATNQNMLIYIRFMDKEVPTTHLPYSKKVKGADEGISTVLEILKEME